MSENATVDKVEALQSKSQDSAKSEPKVKLHTSYGMSAPLMAQILTAELLVEKGLPAQAYELLYPLAEQTRDVGLIERVFQLSMTSYNESEVFKVTQLWLEIDPSNPTPWRAAFLMSLREGNLPLAKEQWNEYRKLSDEEISEDVLSTAQRVVRAAKADVAIPFYDQIVMQNDKLWQAHYGYGVLATHYGFSERAIESLQRALELLPSSDTEEEFKQQATTQIYQLLSQSYLHLEDPNQGLEVLTAYLKSEPEDWLVQERLARLEVKAERLKEALQRYQMILDANPEAVTSRLSLALLQIELGSIEEAQTNLLQVTQEGAYESVGFYYLGVLSQEQGKFNDAVGYFNRVGTLPYLVDAKLHIAEIVYPDKGLDASLKVLSSFEPTTALDQVKVLRAKGIFYRVSGKNELAVQSYADALKLAPQNQEMLLSQAALFYELKTYSAYVKNLEQVLALNPDSVDALNALGYYYVEQGHSLDKATPLLERALKLAPDSYYVLDSVGWLAYQKKDYKTAENYLIQSLAIAHDEEVLMHLIATRWQMGEKQAAEQLWQKHYVEFSNNPRYQSLIENLQSGVAIK